MIVGKDGLPRVVDFGVARLRWQPVREAGSDDPAPRGCEPSATTTQGGISGTPGYMSPEQHDGQSSDAASDQFSFCVSLYEALYGRLPFLGPALAEPGHRYRVPRPPPPGTPVPPELFGILRRGLADAPGARYPSMAALLRALSAEHEQTAAGAARARRGIMLAFAGVAILTWLLAHYLAAEFERIAPHAIGLSLLILSVFLGAGYLQRRVLRVNPFHRRMWTLITINVVQNLLMRIVTARTPQLPFRAAFAMEMIVWTGTALAVATMPARAARWVPALPLLAGATALLFEGAPRQLLLLAYPLTGLSLMWGWRCEARAAARAGSADSP